MASKTKNCPYCSEVIRVAAKKCKHCGEFLEKDEKSEGKTSEVSRMMSRKTTIVISVVLSIIILSFVISLYMNRSNSKYKEEEARQQQELEDKEAERKRMLEERKANEKLEFQKRIDQVAIDGLNKAISNFYECFGGEKHNMQFWADCVVNANIPIREFEGTSCDEELNNIVKAGVEAREHCRKAGYYEDGQYLRAGASLETYTNESTGCMSATDQLIPVYRCGLAYYEFE